MQEKAIEYVELMKYEIDLYDDFVSEQLKSDTQILYELLEDASKEERITICRELLSSVHGKTYMKIWIYSFAVFVTKDDTLLSECLEWLLECSRLKRNTLCYLYWQITSKMFEYKVLASDKNNLLNWKLYLKFYNLFKEEVLCDLHKMNVRDRNDDLAIVITSQFLAVQHGPTKTALDRCYTLMCHMGKRVVLINSAEMANRVGEIPFFKRGFGNYNDHITDNAYVEWRGAKIPYFQCSNDMPNMEVLKVLVNKIYDMKPGVVVSIGSGNMLAALVNEIIPVLEIPLTTSRVSLTLSDYQIVPEQEIEHQKYLLEEIGKKEDHAIIGKFTFSLKEQTQKVSRQELGLPDRAFLLCVIGSRLDVEITEDFVRMLESVLSDAVQIVFMGHMPTYPQLCRKYVCLEKYSFYLGTVEDILSRVELCDLYVNPERAGGGTSCVEAMFKGLPVVTTEYGDVAGIAGSVFSCADYEEMASVIQEYATNKEFYEEQSFMAREIAREYMDTEKEFERCVRIYVERMKQNDRVG